MKDKNTKYFAIGIVSLFLMLSTASCALLDSMFQDKVVTTIDNVKPEDRELAVPADFGSMDPATRKKFEDAGKTPVIIDKGSLIDPIIAVDLTDPGDGVLDAVVGIGLGIANTVWPGIAALEGLGLLFSQRKRQHYGEAVKKAAPVNGKVELKDALVSLGRAVGFAHSSESSKEAFKSESVKAA